MSDSITEDAVSRLSSDDILSRLMSCVEKVATISRTNPTDPMLVRYQNDARIFRQELLRRSEVCEILDKKWGVKRVIEKSLGKMFTIPNEYNPASCVIMGGDINCRHDFIEELKKIDGESISWQCSRCGQTREYKKRKVS